MIASAYIVQAGFSLFIHAGEHVKGMNRIKVEYGFWIAAVAFFGVVAGNNKQVLQIMPVPAKEQRLHLVSVFVLAGKMDNYLGAHGQNFRTKSLWRESGLASGIFCNAEGLKTPVCSNIFRQIDDPVDFLCPASPSWDEFKCQGKFIRVFERTAQF